MQHTPYALARLAGALALTLAAGSAFTQASPASTWRTIDDNTGKQKGGVAIVDDDDTFTGKASKVPAPDDENKTCTKCTGDRKNQPIKGLTILTGLKPNGNSSWDGSQILDPEDDRVYGTKMSLSEDGQKLNVHDYLGVSLLDRTQAWIREQ